MCKCLSTHTLKLIVVVLTLIITVDGLIKLSTNATMLLYYYRSKYSNYLIARTVLGFALTTWAFYGFIMLFYDSVKGLAIYATGICALTTFDIATLVFRFTLDGSEKFPLALDLKERLLARAPKVLSQDMVVLEEGFGIFLLIFHIVVQIVACITGWWLAFRLREHYQQEEQYYNDQMRLAEMRRHL